MTPGDNTTFVIDGDSLAAAFRYCPETLCQVALEAFRVVCCRMTPLQKAQVVSMVKESNRHPITAAVGDGANDVAMIQEAHIGIGKKICYHIIIELLWSGRNFRIKVELF